MSDAPLNKHRGNSTSEGEILLLARDDKLCGRLYAYFLFVSQMNIPLYKGPSTRTGQRVRSGASTSKDKIILPGERRIICKYNSCTCRVSIHNTSCTIIQANWSARLSKIYDTRRLPAVSANPAAVSSGGKSRSEEARCICFQWHLPDQSKLGPYLSSRLRVSLFCRPVPSRRERLAHSVTADGLSVFPPR